MTRRPVCFSGLDGATGRPLLDPRGLGELAQEIAGLERSADRVKSGFLETLWERLIQRRRVGVMGVIEGTDPLLLEQARWGVVYTRETPEPVKVALRDLVAYRRGRELICHPNEKSWDFRDRHGLDAGVVDPEKLPYYLLLVASPEEISFEFQHGLATQHAVGRIHFNTPDDYRSYAESVIAYDEACPLRSRRIAAFFSPQHPDDEVTAAVREELAAPLADRVEGRQLGPAGGERVSYEVERHFGPEASRDRLLSLLGRTEDAPSLLFTAGHGLGFSSGHPRQRRDQGALVCQDWPGPTHWPEGREIPASMVLQADELPPEVRCDGLVVFSFACYSAGTPEREEVIGHPGCQQMVAPVPFSSQLASWLLARGALGFIGHVGRAWDYSFLALQGGRRLETFSSTLEALLKGKPLGHCLEEYFSRRYLDLNHRLGESQDDSLLRRYRLGEPIDPEEIVKVWTARNDARAYVLFGDPFARLAPDRLRLGRRCQSPEPRAGNGEPPGAAEEAR